MYIKRFAAFLLLFAMLLPGPVRGEKTPEMSLLALSVGKADCLLLRSGDDAYLIDTANAKAWPDVLRALTREGVPRLTGVILTHTDSDHAGGLKKLISSAIPVEHVYASAYYNKKESKHPAVKALKKTGLRTEFLSAGDALPLGEGTLTVLGPLSRDPVNENCNSLVLLAQAAGGTILLTGDMEYSEEADLLRAGAVPRADVLKVGHHGEKDATSDAFISVVQPSVAVISTDTSEEPDTPAPRVLRLLSAWNVQVLQTQQSPLGVRVVIRDGQIVTARNE